MPHILLMMLGSILFYLIIKTKLFFEVYSEIWVKSMDYLFWLKIMVWRCLSLNNISFDSFFLDEENLTHHHNPR